jgi:hypothetical protein
MRFNCEITHYNSTSQPLFNNIGGDFNVRVADIFILIR